MLGVLPVGDLAKDSDELFDSRPSAAKISHRKVFINHNISPPPPLRKYCQTFMLCLLDIPNFLLSLQNTQLTWVHLDSRCSNAPSIKKSDSDWLQYHLVLCAHKSLSHWKGWHLPASAFGFCFTAHQVLAKLGSQLCSCPVMWVAVISSLIFNVIPLNFFSIPPPPPFLKCNFSCTVILTFVSQNCPNSRFLVAILNSKNSCKR